MGVHTNVRARARTHTHTHYLSAMVVLSEWHMIGDKWDRRERGARDDGERTWQRQTTANMTKLWWHGHDMTSDGWHKQNESFVNQSCFKNGHGTHHHTEYTYYSCHKESGEKIILASGLDFLGDATAFKSFSCFAKCTYSFSVTRSLWL